MEGTQGIGKGQVKNARKLNSDGTFVKIFVKDFFTNSILSFFFN